MRQLTEDAQVLAKAELAYQKSRAAYAGAEAKRIAIFVVLAIFVAFFALMALIVGFIIALTPLLTAWGATAAVFGALALIAGFCALTALATWRRMKVNILDKDRA